MHSEGTAGNDFGWAVSDAGDVDGDGHDDVIVGAPRDAALGLDAGAAWVLSGRDGTTLQLLQEHPSRAAGQQLGWSVSELLGRPITDD